MPDFLTSLTYWSWWILAVLFVIVEILAPGAHFLWLGLAAGAVGFIVLIIPGMGWELQVTIFAVLSVVSIVAGRTYLRRNPLQTEDSNLNRRGEQYVGRVFTLVEPIVNGAGKLIVDDTTWKIEGDDLAAGTKVRVTGVDGTSLTVVEDDV